MNNEIMPELESAHYKSREFEEKINLIRNEINEMQDFENAISELEKTNEKEILASIGKGVFIKSEIKDRRLFVDVGKGIFIRKSISEAKEIVNEQIKRLIGMRNELESQYYIIEDEMRRLIQKSENI